MSQITIQCRLFADETARQYLWELMCDRHTPLINELLQLVALHPDFLTWRSQGKLPTAEVTKLAKTLKIDPRFSNQPAKFHISAEKTVLYILKGWLASQKDTQQQLTGKRSWLRMLRTNEESIADCGQDLEQIRLIAQALLVHYQSSEDTAESRENLRKSLYQAYDRTEDALMAIAIDLATQKVLTYRSPKQLLGDNYRLLNRRRRIQTQQRHLNHKAQKKGLTRQLSNSELGEHLDRLLAKSIFQLAQAYGAGSIALPKHQPRDRPNR